MRQKLKRFRKCLWQILSNTEVYPRDNKYTSRPVENYNTLFSPFNIVEILKNIQSPQHEIRLLELGIGQGRVLMQLRKLFSEMELHGISQKKWQLLNNPDYIKQTAVYWNIFTESEVNQIKLPVLHFRDINHGNLAFLPSNYFDLIISQVSFGYIHQKARLIEEFWRVLKPNGIALHDLDNFIIMNSGNSLALKHFFEKIHQEGFQVKAYNMTLPFLHIQKNTEEPLSLKLTPYTIKYPIFADPRDDVRK
ncbi:MAG: class I SAM-dependent methyltransferase [Cyanobacteria bacterium P01_H01_bin.15]